MARRLGGLILWAALGGAALPPPPAPAPFDLSKLPICGEDDTPAPQKTVLLSGYGQGGFTIRTTKPEAQAFFTNGMQLGAAFAHKASVAAFVEARRIDPDCAMCAWGEAWATGPTINFRVDDETKKKLVETVAQAEKLAANGPELERQLIAALKLRYQGTEKDGNKAFAAAMDGIAKAHPQDDALAVLAADAWIVASDFEGDGAAQMARPVELLEAVLKRNPDYAPAIHFYIHATEFAGYAARAEPFADRLAIVAPSASHLVHMPSHTYYWVGRYADAATSNVKAVEIDNANAIRRGLTKPYAAFGMGDYHWHNVHFGIGGALMAGDAEAALKLARPLIAFASTDKDSGNSFAQAVVGEGYVAVGLFAPKELLAMADPGKDRPIAQAMWRYARGEALARGGDVAGVKAELKALRRVKGKDAAPFVKVAGGVLQGRFAMLRGKPGNAVKLLDAAAKAEETGPFAKSSDPPIWWYPVRRSLAAARLQAGDAAGAVTEATASLKRRPNDPMGLTRGDNPLPAANIS
jgi:tetratricopeptide (TPR) repeat protein